MAKSAAALRELLTLTAKQQREILDECHRRLWNHKHKKRRDYDPSDAAAIAELWDDITFHGGQVSASVVSVFLHKFGKDRPFELKLRDGNRVTKLS